MSDGAPAYSHVPAHGGRPIYRPLDGAPLFRRTRTYWRCLWALDFVADWFGPGDEDWEAKNAHCMDRLAVHMQSRDPGFDESQWPVRIHFSGSGLHWEKAWTAAVLGTDYPYTREGSYRIFVNTYLKDIGGAATMEPGWTVNMSYPAGQSAETVTVVPGISSSTTAYGPFARNGSTLTCSEKKYIPLDRGRYSHECYVAITQGTLTQELLNGTGRHPLCNHAAP